ncbi:hypothetical protein Asi02nite_80260 [Asanoa siamensis]|uniref:Uncharacterized protein n=1 Tax=Asanoa siamensis TaxID=926357 RepID=A0ABQ4D4P0_9ACTN|nr:hypothetical protein Asi02nite_80260 [Asanoa siamensis]
MSGRRIALNATGGRKSWGYLQNALLGNGYLPGRAAAWFIALAVAGSLFFAEFPPIYQSRLVVRTFRYSPTKPAASSIGAPQAPRTSHSRTFGGP